MILYWRGFYQRNAAVFDWSRNPLRISKRAHTFDRRTEIETTQPHYL